MKLGNKALWIVVAVFFVSITSSAEVTIPPRPDNYVVDLAGIIDNPTELTLDRYLRELEYKTSAQMVILTIDSLQGEQIEELSLKIAHDMWKLGQKGKDNGVLLLIAHYDRKYRFEVGYGLEALLPDSYVGSVGRQFLVPNFRNENYSRGIELATVAVISPLASDAGVEITGMQPFRFKEPGKVNKSDTTKISDLIIAIPGILFFIYIFYIVFKYSYTLKPHGDRNNSSWWQYGGGFGGYSGGGFSGGIGGFGGGGGGGFGGAGATGGW